MKVILILFLMLAPLVLLADENSEVGLIINMMGSDGYGDRSTDNAYIEKDIHRIFPTLEVQVVNVESVSVLPSILQTFFNTNPKKVRALFVLGHGTGAGGPSIASQHGSIELGYGPDVREKLGVLSDHWAKDPLVVFISCSLLGAGDVTYKARMAVQVARNLGIGNGKIFLMEQQGSFSTRAVTGTSILAKEGSFTLRKYRLAYRIGKVVGSAVPVLDLAIKGWDAGLYVNDRILTNHGYLLKLDNDTGVFSQTSYWNIVNKPYTNL